MTALRIATAADEALVSAIAREAYEEYVTLLGHPPMPAVEVYAPRIAAGQVWLLGDVGSLVLERHADHALIYSVALRPEGQGKGFGRFLLDAAERMAASWGLTEIRLYTHSLMTRNQAIYAARGYREVGRRPHPKRASFTIVDMVKPIAPPEAEIRRLLDVMARQAAQLGLGGHNRLDHVHDGELGALRMRASPHLAIAASGVDRLVPRHQLVGIQPDFA